MRSSSVKYRNLNSSRRFGVEIEMGHEIKKKQVQVLLNKHSLYPTVITRYALSSNNLYWHVKDDATCGIHGRYGPKGVEIASYIGSGIGDIDHISNTAEKLAQSGCRVNDNCGLHIHAEVLDLTPAQIGVVMAHWIKFEHLLSLALPVRRRNNEFCRYTIHPCASSADYCGKIVRQETYDAISFCNMIMPQNIAIYDNHDRRINLNLVNLARSLFHKNSYRRTMELRWPEGTLDARDIRCWLHLFLSFIENTKNRSMPKNLYSCDLDEGLSYLGMNHERGKFIILSQGLFETKTWFLERILKFYKENVDFSHNPIYAASVAISTQKALRKMWHPVRKYN